MKNWLKRFKHGFHIRYSAWLMQGLSRIIFWSHKFKQRLSPLGRFVAAAMLLTLVFGSNIKLSSIYQLFALLTALLFTALLLIWLKSKTFKPELEVKRQLPQFATVDVPTSYRIQVKNPSKKDYYNLNVGELQSLAKSSLTQFLNTREPLEEQRNWYDRHTGFYRFVWLQDWLRGAKFSSQGIEHVKVGETVSSKIKLTPMRRGYIHFSAMRVRFPEPLGLAYSFKTCPLVESLLVLPKAYDLPHDIAKGGKRSYQQGGVSQASHVGESEEFSRLREYRDGDSPRHLYWPSLARASKPLIKEFQDEYFTRAALVLDNFTSVESREQKRPVFEEVVSVAAGFAMQADSNDMLLDLMFVGADKHAEHQLVGRALAHAEHMLETLATVELCDAEFQSLSKVVLGQSERLSGCMLILLDWDAPRQALVEQLHALSIPSKVFLIQENDAVPVRHEHVIPLRMGYIQQDLDKLL